MIRALILFRLPESEWFEINGVTYKYKYRDDKDVIDGLEYTYSVVAYDMGRASFRSSVQ